MTAIETAIAGMAAVAATGVVVAKTTFRLLQQHRDTEPLPRLRRRFYPAIGLAVAAAGVCGWAVASHHTGVAVATVIAIMIVQEFILLPLRIRRSRRATESARTQRLPPDRDKSGPSERT
jgi:hypothetical protein